MANTSWSTNCSSVNPCCRQPGNNGGDFGIGNHGGLGLLQIRYIQRMVSLLSTWTFSNICTSNRNFSVSVIKKLLDSLWLLDRVTVMVDKTQQLLIVVMVTVDKVELVAAKTCQNYILLKERNGKLFIL